jgi:phosphoserine aminotransferase
MTKTYFTPGPSQLYPSVSAHIQTALSENIGCISHRSADYKTFHKAAVDSIKTLLNIPNTHEVLFFASATEIWERLLQNLLAPDETSLHFVNGVFSARFFQIAQELQVNCIKQEVEGGQGFSFSPKIIPYKIGLLNFTHNESSTGVMQPLETIYTYKKAFPDAFTTLDIVSSAPHPEIDFRFIDAAYFSVQKGFGLPAGLGVLILNEKCIEKAKSIVANGHSIGSYHAFPEMWKKAKENQTQETPNILAIYLLSKVGADFVQKSAAIIREETQQKMQIITDLLDNSKGKYRYFVENPDFRSPTVLTIATELDCVKLIAHCAAHNCIIGSGYGIFKGKQIRIANFPAHSIADFEKLKVVMEAFEG